MSTITTLTNSIKSRVAAVAGSNYSEAGYGIDLLKNSKNNSELVYSVIPKGIVDAATVTKSVTYDERFTINLSNIFINEDMSDAQEQIASIALLELTKNLFKDLVATRCGSPSICLNITELEVNDPIHVPDADMVIVEMSFIVKYRELL